MVEQNTLVSSKVISYLLRTLGCKKHLGFDRDLKFGDQGVVSCGGGVPLAFTARAAYLLSRA